MAEFSVGNKVILIDTNVRGVIVEVLPPRRGRQIYRVSFPSGITDELEPDLRLDFDENDPFDCCKNGLFGSYADYTKINTTFKIENSNNNTISSLKASKTLFRAYQFKPLLKFLNSPNRRILIADEVGLGKTIEAGHVMLELKARNELKNALIICPKSLQDKWKAELLEKFGLVFDICDDTKKLIQDLSSGMKTVRSIINYERIRIKPVKENKEKNTKSGKKTINLIDYLLEHPTKFSIVLCDEAHKMRNKDTQTYKGAEIIMGYAESALFLTATPVMISEENLFNLLHLLDNENYFNYQIFKNRLEENKPFVEALTWLNNGYPLNAIKDKLLNTEIVQRFYNSEDEEIFANYSTLNMVYKDDDRFHDIISLLDGTDSNELRAKLQYLISSMSVMNNVFSRTRKVEVTTDLSQAKRNPIVRKVILNEEEKVQFDSVIEEYTDDNSYVDDWGEEKLTYGGMLGLVQKKRQVASSVWGYLNNEEELDKGIDSFAEYPDAKVDKLIEIIKEVFDGDTKKLVVFALFRKTLKYLALRLKKAGYNALIIHGQIGSEERTEILNKFKHDTEAHILLSSEVGSEGLDMQFCSSMVNFDLPWNPMVVEQRIGRIDRFGQKAEVVNIYNILVSGSIQEMIYMRLLERIGIFRGTIGDLEAILDAPAGNGLTIQDVYNKMEKEFFTQKLTKEERSRKIANVERAIENENENLKHLKKELTNALTNDSYFTEEIKRILEKNAYVSGEELKNYLESVIRKSLPSCILEEVRENIYKFSIPLSEPKSLTNFLTQYGDELNEENRLNLSSFKRKVEGKKSFLLTFDQQEAYNDSSLFYLNIYHPFIIACLRFFKGEETKVQYAFSYGINETEELKAGNMYYLGIYKMTTTRKLHSTVKSASDLLPVLYSITDDALVKDQKIVDTIYKFSQAQGIEKNASNCAINQDLIENMRVEFTSFISSERKRRIKESQKQIENDKKRNVDQTNKYFESRIKGLEKQVDEYEKEVEWTQDEKEIKRLQNTIRLRLGTIRQLIRERDERLALMNEDSRLEITYSLLSLNLITII